MRTALTESLPWLQRHPEDLRLFTDSERIASTLANSLSFEYQFRLNLLITDYTGDMDFIIVPILAWLCEHQPDIMATEEKRRTGYTFEADINNDGSFDISINLQLTERVIVKEQAGALLVDHLPEPPLPENVTRPMQLYVHGELVSRWHK
ncbi:phage tail protein [Serratia oryzae]|uniref:phage tail protein n=1 Tax=Serratia oryzae TaxID=2034155 RepID=UPI0012F38299|nr:Phage tail protein [Enterobacterales bacterium 8AC]